MTTDVRDFLERDKALCSLAFDGDRDGLVRAAEMIHSAEKNAKQSGIPLDDSDLHRGDDIRGPI